MAISANRHPWNRDGRFGFLEIGRRRAWGQHTHEYAEVFWCESGSAIHQVNGQESRVSAGDVVCIRPDDMHAAIPDPGGFTIVNLTFQPATVAGLAERHAATWPWRPGPLPMQVHLPPRRMERLHAWSAELAVRRATLLDLETFLLDLARMLAEGGGEADPLPPWLREAIERLRDPERLAGGTPALARLAGRDPAHINRVLRRCLGRTATDLVTELRLDRAAAELRMGDRPVAEIAGLVGLANLSHFYERFQARFGATPARYRQAAQQTA
jgi:AraC-like DNA-binding protein/mannose-6-phosphate isomerase-like protein (cupin superfamily)